MNSISNDILKHITKFNGNISKNDLSELQKLLTEIKADYTEEHKAYDAGQTSIGFYDYKQNTIVTIKSVGDYNIKNIS